MAGLVASNLNKWIFLVELTQFETFETRRAFSDLQFEGIFTCFPCFSDDERRNQSVKLLRGWVWSISREEMREVGNWARASFPLFALRKRNKGVLVVYSAVRKKPTRLVRSSSQTFFFSRTLAAIQKGTAGSMTGALWAKRGERDISSGARHEREAREEGKRKIKRY